MDNILKDYFNRPIYKNLTLSILSSIPDNALVQTVIDNIQTKFKADFSNQYEIVTKLSKGRQAVYTTFYLEAEVCNGGFNQYFYNSSRRFAEEACQGLALIGAVKLTSLVKQAISTYSDNEEQITLLQDGTLEGFSDSYEDNPLDELDEKFYTLKREENLQAMRISYIRSHSEEFIDND